MRFGLVLLLVVWAALSMDAAFQEKSEKQEDPNRSRVEVSGCVKGSMLTETNLRVTEGERDGNPARRWRLRGPKALMKQLKEQSQYELLIVGTTSNPRSGMVIGSKRIGRTNIYIGGNPDRMSRDPLPEQPTIDVESFESTGATCG